MAESFFDFGFHNICVGRYSERRDWRTRWSHPSSVDSWYPTLKSVNFRPWAVLITTVLSLDLITPRLISLVSTARATPVWGQVNIPVKSACAAAAANSFSVACSTIPSVSTIALYGFGVTDRITNPDGVGQRVLCLDDDFFFESVFERFVKWIGLGGLGSDEPWHSGDQPKVHHQLETFVKRADVSEIANRDHDPIGHFPLKLSNDFDADRLLAFDAQAVHRIGKVDRIVLA